MDTMRFLSACVAGGSLVVGCSSEGGGTGHPSGESAVLPSSPGGASSGATATGGGSGPDPGDASRTVQDCIDACEAKYPDGAVLGRAIDACWKQSCPVVCNGIGEGSAQGPTSGSCKTDVKTPSAACSTCTVQHCCAAWDACYTDLDCIALNACSIACYK